MYYYYYYLRTGVAYHNRTVLLFATGEIRLIERKIIASLRKNIAEVSHINECIIVFLSVRLLLFYTRPAMSRRYE